MVGHNMSQIKTDGGTVVRFSAIEANTYYHRHLLSLKSWGELKDDQAVTLGDIITRIRVDTVLWAEWICFRQRYGDAFMKPDDPLALSKADTRQAMAFRVPSPNYVCTGKDIREMSGVGKRVKLFRYTPIMCTFNQFNSWLIGIMIDPKLMRKPTLSMLKSKLNPAFVDLSSIPDPSPEFTVSPIASLPVPLP